MAAGRRILLAYLVYYAAIGAAFPYLPVFYRDLGLELAEIGILTAIQAAGPARSWRRSGAASPTGSRGRG